MNHSVLKKEARKFFKSHTVINCPAFRGEKIFLNAKGLNHLLYKGSRSGRDINQIRVRVALLDRAIRILSTMPYFQEERVLEINGTVVRYWSFEAVVEEKRLKVIVRQVGNGSKHFWSLVPSWTRINNKRINTKSKLEDY